MGKAPLKIRTYAVCTLFNGGANPRATARIVIVEVPDRNPVGPAIPDKTFCVRFHDQPDPIEIENRTATFPQENISENIYIAKKVIPFSDIEAAVKGGVLSRVWQDSMQESFPSSAVIIDRNGHSRSVKAQDRVVSEKGTELWPTPPKPLW